MEKLNLILGVHSHQPVGNFDFVFQDAFQKAYRPFLEVVREHPSVGVTFHFSGPLFDWFESRQPGFLEDIKELVRKGQAELLTGGYYEPILSILPDADKVGQVLKLSSYIRRCFDFEPKGAWVAERVWEPHLAKPLSEAGVEFVILDDSHFKSAGLKDTELSGYFVTEEQGICLKVFPIDKRLRYLIPFAETGRVLEHLQKLHSQKRGRAAVIVDDGEKFGIWPGTYDWVYEKGWLHRFLGSLEENRDWLQVVTFSDFLSRQKALGRIYLPAGSYDEMMEWALPYEARVNYESVLQKIKNNEMPEEAAAFFKGGFWRNFLVKYPESNHLHKRMLRVSKKIQELEEGDQDLPPHNPVQGKTKARAGDKIREQAREELYRSQCNDVYWHGIFGGLYLPHLRHAAYLHLIRAESLVDKLIHREKSWVECRLTDLDADGQEDLMVTTPNLALFFDLGRGGSLVELDYRLKAINLTNTMTRQPEAYHSKVREAKNHSPSAPQRIRTIHEMEPRQQTGLEDLLCYDWYRRACLLDHFLAPEAGIGDFSRCQYPEWGDFVNQKYNQKVQKPGKEAVISLWRDGHIWFPGGPVPVRVEKRIVVRGDSSRVAIRYRVKNLHSSVVRIIFGAESNWNLLAESAPDRYYRINGKEPDNPALGSWGELNGVEEIRMVDEATGIFVLLHLEAPARLWRFPIHTVSQSENGLEKIYQGSSLLPHWDLDLAPQKEWKMAMEIEIGDHRGP